MILAECAAEAVTTVRASKQQKRTTRHVDMWRDEMRDLDMMSDYFTYSYCQVPTTSRVVLSLEIIKFIIKKFG